MAGRCDGDALLEHPEGRALVAEGFVAMAGAGVYGLSALPRPEWLEPDFVESQAGDRPTSLLRRADGKEARG